MKLQFVLSQSTACLVTEKEKKRAIEVRFLASHFGLYSLLFVCFNKHTRTRVQNLKLCCKFMFGQILFFKLPQIKGSLWKNRTKVWQRWPVLQCHLHVSELCHIHLSPSPKHSVSQIGV